MVDGHPLAVWRGEDGAPNVWQDRCPHRGMRLSFGFVRGNTLRCIYHGWGYEAGGQCVSIPAHPALTPPKTICATVFPSKARYGLLWTNLAAEPAAPLPDFGADEGWHPIRSLYVNRPLDATAERLATADCGIPEATVKINGQECATIETGDGLTVLVAMQAVGPEKTGLHVVARGEGASETGRRLHLARKMQRLRNALEA